MIKLVISVLIMILFMIVFLWNCGGMVVVKIVKNVKV